jgi:hypothetical protein
MFVVIYPFLFKISFHILNYLQASHKESVKNCCKPKQNDAIKNFIITLVNILILNTKKTSLRFSKAILEVIL